MYTTSARTAGSVFPMALTSLHLADIPEEGLSLDCVVQPDELTLEPGDAQVQRELVLSAEIVKADNGVNVSGVLAGTFLRQCVRCLKEYEDPTKLSFAVEYRRKQNHGGKEGSTRRHDRPSSEGEMEQDSEEVYPLVGDRLDLAEMLREQVILATPIQPLCHEGCLGLCPACGQDLNERRCGCPEERRENPFADLQRKVEARGDRR
ncbi:MAG: DUF177 domain-containing protein [Nitrospirae bacterium]|nr:DUF177 domain-containing protein [Nitrospirota bacterium]